MGFLTKINSSVKLFQRERRVGSKNWALASAVEARPVSTREREPRDQSHSRTTEDNILLPPLLPLSASITRTLFPQPHSFSLLLRIKSSLILLLTNRTRRGSERDTEKLNILGKSPFGLFDSAAHPLASRGAWDEPRHPEYRSPKSDDVYSTARTPRY